MGATHVEKSTMDDSSRVNQLSAVGGSYGAVSEVAVDNAAPKACSILDPDCEACQ
jgi:ribonucleoside-diphosphate reductase alpha chain